MFNPDLSHTAELMELLAESIHLITETFIRGSFVSVIVIIIGRVLFKDKIDTTISLAILSWILVVYALANGLHTLINLLFGQEERSAFFTRTTGPYTWAYLAMLIANSVVPLFLLHPRLGSKIWIVLLVTLLMNIGWLFESFVIHVTSLHRDYLPNDWSVRTINYYLPYFNEVLILAKGAFVGLVLVAIGWLANMRNPKSYV